VGRSPGNDAGPRTGDRVQLAPDGTVIVSATDLVGFLACDHLTSLELGRIEGRWDRPPRREDPTVQLMQDRGDAHELAHVERLRARGLSVVEIDKEDLTTADRLRAAEAATLDAMQAGADVVYQATFFDGRWRGHADFLYKRPDRPSPRLGSWSYDVADTKLARGVKGGALLQLCVYADLLGRLQGVAPERLYVVTGDSTEHEFRFDEVAAYYRHVRRRFDARVGGGHAGASTYPDPVDHCHVCAWYPRCIQQRRDDDHLSIVAGIRRVDTERLMAAEVPTLAALAALPREATPPDVRPHVLGRLRDQARLQLHERETGDRVWEFVAPNADDPGKGLAALPEPSPWDVFLDIEADPWALDDGLEYLLGVGTLDADGGTRFEPLWGHDRAGEKAAFETFIDLVIRRLDAHPEMHLYHYGGYESGALKRLMQRHATRIDEVDRLLRAGVLVDLLTVVRQGIRASVESYSLKQIERFYLAAREGPVTEAGFSVIEYERWMRERDPTILANIEAYNRDDVVSTRMLRDWLEDRRAEAVTRFPDAAWSRPEPSDGAPSEALGQSLTEVAARVAALTEGVPADRAERTPDQAARWLLAQLLDWHRRDEKPAWWLWHDLRRRTTDELIESGEAIGGLAYVRDVERRKSSVVRRYRFPPQDHKFRPGDAPIDPNPDFGDYGQGAGEIAAIDDAAGTIDLIRGPARIGHHPSSLLPATPIDSKPMREALLRVADAVIDGGPLDAAGPGVRYRAARDLLLRRAPRIRDVPDGARLRGDDEPLLDAARRLAVELDASVLPVQGPPGTGKTYTGARMIVALVERGCRVGIAAQSHKAITNLLREVCAAADEAGARLRAIQKCERSSDAAAGLDMVTVATSNKAVDEALAGGLFDVVAGTAWLFSRAVMDGRLDALVVDEAGQMSLANTVAMSTAATSLILLGDPNQLPQVSQGVHPEGAAASALEHLVGSALTVDPARGLFLDMTWRMHPDVTGYISDTFYDGRLGAHPSTTGQAVEAQDATWAGTGVRWLPVEHRGNDSDSPEEAALVADAIAALVGRPWIDRTGVRRPVGLDDILVVAPYNAHVAAIERAVAARLGPAVAARIGTVDRFQGQEGAVAIYSMASSSADDAPRDLAFLYSRNRLNVAVSRARAVAAVIASPTLLDVACRTPEQMRLLNALCRFVEVADEQALARAGGVEILSLGLS
jgi:uncharacterized protein